MTTGFSVNRAAPHDEFSGEVHAELSERGYKPRWLPVNGNDPDIAITDLNGKQAYVDAKTRYSKHSNYSVKHGALACYTTLTNQGTPVYIIWQDWNVDTVYTLAARIVGGPHRSTGQGSRTDWILIEPGGTPFNAFFRARP